MRIYKSNCYLFNILIRCLVLIKEFSSFYYVSLVLFSVSIALIASCLALFNKSHIKLAENQSFKIYDNNFLIIILGFMFYVFMPIDLVNDYIPYAEHYISRQAGSYSESYAYFSSRDLLFFNYVEFFSSLGVNYRLAYGLIVGFYLYSISLVAIKNKINVWIVFLFVFLFGNILFVVSGLRQAAAMAFILLAYNFYIEKRWFLVVGFVLLASGFHSSAILAVLLICLSVFFLYLKISKYFLIFICFLSFPLLFGQIVGVSLINNIFPYFYFLISDNYSNYTGEIYAFDSIGSIRLGFVFFTISKLVFLMSVLWLSLKNKLDKSYDLIIILSLFYVLYFNVMGLNQYTHRLLNYLVPFFIFAMSIVIVKISSLNNLYKLISVLFLSVSGLFSMIVLLR